MQVERTRVVKAQCGDIEVEAPWLACQHQDNCLSSQ